jgi:hypothetical protein
MLKNIIKPCNINLAIIRFLVPYVRNISEEKHSDIIKKMFSEILYIISNYLLV